MHERTLQYIGTITTLFITIRLVDILIDSWTQMGDVMSDAISHGRDVIDRIEQTILRLHYIWRYCRYCGEIALLYVEDLNIFVRRRHRFHPEQTALLVRSAGHMIWYHAQ